jgi:hypothetical protein
MSQTTAPLINQETAFAGLIADSFQPKDVLSKVNLTELSYLGRFVSRAAGGDDRIKAPAAAGDVAADTLVGVVGHSHAQESTRDSEDPAYAIKATVPVLKKGRIWVVVEEAVDAGKPVYVRHTANGPLVKLGACRSDADTANAAVAPGCFFASTATAAGLAQVDVNLPA